MRRAAPFVVPQHSALTRVGGCGCGSTPTTAAVMSILGMTIAASMHKRGALQRDWTGVQWQTHIEEEASKLFPALRMFVDEEDEQKIKALEDDHVVYLALIEKNLPLPPWPGAAHSVADHSKTEDRLVEKYSRQLLSWAKENATSVAGPSDLVIQRVVPADEAANGSASASVSTWTLGKLAMLGGLLAVGGWAYGWLGAALAGAGGALVIPRIVNATSSKSAEAVDAISTIHLTSPPPGAAKPSTVDMGALQDQFDQEVTNYYNERNAREKAYDDDMDTYAKWVGSAGPEAYAAAKILAGAAKALGAAIKSFQHNPDAERFVEDAKRLWVMIGQSGLAPPPYGPVADVINIETYKSNLYDTIDKLRTPGRGLAYQPAMLELGYWTKKTIASDPKVAAWYAALANGGRIGKTAGEIRGEGPPCIGPGNRDYTACHAGSVMSVWDASSAALAGTVAAAVMGVPISGPVNAAVASLEGFAGRHPGVNTGNNDNSEFNLAQIIATVDAWNAAKAEAAREAGKSWPSAGKIDAPWPMTGDI